MKRFKRPVFFMAVASLLLLLAGCQMDKTIKIGIVGTMTGANSDLSVSGRRGAELAAEEINNKGGINGKQVALVVKDDQNDPQIALEMDKAFVSEDIRLIIGHYTSGMVVGAMSYLDGADVLMLGPTISVDTLSEKDDHFIRFIASTKEQAMALVNQVHRLGQQEITILFDERNKGFTDQLVLNFQTQMMQKIGKSAVVRSFNPEDPKRLEQTLNLIKADTPEGLFIIASAEDCAKIAQAIKSDLPKLQLYGPLWANTPELVRKGGTAVEGMLIVGGIDLKGTAPKFAAFKSNYEARYGDTPTFASMYSYETMMALAKAIDKGNSTKPDNVKENLIQIGVFEGIQGIFAIDSFGDNTREYLIFEINQGALRKVE